MYPQKGICIQRGVSSWHGVLKAGANTWAAVEQPQILRVWGIWVGTPLPTASFSCRPALSVSPALLVQEKDAEAGLKIENCSPECGEMSVCLGRALSGCGGCIWGDEGRQWGHPWVLASG